MSRVREVERVRIRSAVVASNSIRVLLQNEAVGGKQTSRRFPAVICAPESAHEWRRRRRRRGGEGGGGGGFGYLHVEKSVGRASPASVSKVGRVGSCRLPPP